MGQTCCHSVLKMLKKSILPAKSIDFGYINPRGIYSNEISYDLNIVKHMIRKGRLAPFYDGQSEPCKSKDNLVYDVECPICFLYYPSKLNRTRCCDKSICTECFIQLQTSAVCPFCVQSHFGVLYIPPIWSISFKKKRSDLLLNHSVNKKHWKVEPNDPNVILPIDIRRATGTRLQRCMSSLNHNNTDILILETI